MLGENIHDCLIRLIRIYSLAMNLCFYKEISKRAILLSIKLSFYINVGS